MRRPFAQCCLLLALCLTAPAVHSSGLRSILDSRGAAMVTVAASDEQDSRAVFRRFAGMVIDELTAAGDPETGGRLRQAFLAGKTDDMPKEELAWVIHTFAREYYRDAIIAATGDLIRFRTYATDVPNRMNPEFLAQKEYLRSLASLLGLGFRDVDGFVQEIWIGEGPGSFGIMSHSDVQPVEPTEWAHDPWSGAVIDGAIWGRGAVDDKGPICAVIYGMRAILDSGLPLSQKVILLIGTDEESANEDVATYLSKHDPPDRTIVVDSNFPVVCAEKGWGGIWLSLPRGREPDGDGLRIVDLRSGFSPSIVPEKAVAKLVNTAGPAAQAGERLRSHADAFMQKRAGSDIRITTVADTLVVTARGKSVHSSVPATGHNALMDLLVFLDRDVRPLPNTFALMAGFAARYIGFETDGTSLGLAHHDDFMGDVTVAGDMFYSSDTSVTFMFNFRRPRGLDRQTVEQVLAERFEAYGREHGVTFSDTRYIGEPHYTDPHSPFVRQLLSIYNGITGENRPAMSIGGGTYAQRIPNAVVFGPAMPDEEYLGHQPDERFRITTLIRNIEILTHTMVIFGL